MRAELIRYALGVILGAALGALLVWRWAHDDAEQVIADWERAVQIQRAAERQRTDRLFEETTRGILADRARLWDRLALGWKPAIPAAPGVPPGRVPGPAAGADGAAAPGLPASPGDAQAAAELKTCTAERARLILNGQETMILCQRLQGWVEGVAKKQTP